MTQKQKLLNMLDGDKWVCTSEFYRNYFSDPRTIFSQLKKEGYVFQSRQCEAHNYHDGPSKEWKLIDPHTYIKPEPISEKEWWNKPEYKRKEEVKPEVVSGQQGLFA